jgi:O-acetyl-ADP-ribose deacetylase (regulator of RNase III)
MERRQARRAGAAGLVLPGKSQARGRSRVTTIAFPAISCGVYGYPLDQAVKIAVRECSNFLDRDPSIETIIFACFDAAALAAYRAELKRVTRD